MKSGINSHVCSELMKKCFIRVDFPIPPLPTIRLKFEIAKILLTLEQSMISPSSFRSLHSKNHINI